VIFPNEKTQFRNSSCIVLGLAEASNQTQEKRETHTMILTS
jgi:hypothetical protein